MADPHAAAASLKRRVTKIVNRLDLRGFLSVRSGDLSFAGVDLGSEGAFFRRQIVGPLPRSNHWDTSNPISDLFDLVILNSLI